MIRSAFIAPLQPALRSPLAPSIGAAGGSPPPPSAPALLLEDGSYILLEDGSRLLLE